MKKQVLNVWDCEDCRYPITKDRGMQAYFPGFLHNKSCRPEISGWPAETFTPFFCLAPCVRGFLLSVREENGLGVVRKQGSLLSL